MATECGQELQGTSCNGFDQKVPEGEVNSFEEVKEIIKNNLKNALQGESVGSAVDGVGDDGIDDEDLPAIMNLQIDQNVYEESSLVRMVDAVTEGQYTCPAAPRPLDQNDVPELNTGSSTEDLLDDITSVINADNLSAGGGQQNGPQGKVNNEASEAPDPNAVSSCIGDSVEPHQNSSSQSKGSGMLEKGIGQYDVKSQDSFSLEASTSDAVDDVQLITSPGVSLEETKSEDGLVRGSLCEQSRSRQSDIYWNTQNAAFGSPSEGDVVTDGEDVGDVGVDDTEIYHLSFDEDVEASFEEFQPHWHDSAELIEHGRGRGRPKTQRVPRPAVPPPIAPRPIQPQGPQFQSPTNRSGTAMPRSSQPGLGSVIQRLPVLVHGSPDGSSSLLLQVCTPESYCNPQSQSTDVTLLSPPSVRSSDQHRDESDAASSSLLTKTDLPCSASECAGPSVGSATLYEQNSSVRVLDSHSSVEPDGPPVSRLSTGPSPDYLNGVVNNRIRTANDSRTGMNMGSQSVIKLLCDSDQLTRRIQHGVEMDQSVQSSNMSDQRLYGNNNQGVMGPPQCTAGASTADGMTMSYSITNSQVFSSALNSAQTSMRIPVHARNLVGELGVQGPPEIATLHRPFPTSASGHPASFSPYNQHVTPNTQETLEYQYHNPSTLPSGRRLVTTSASDAQFKAGPSPMNASNNSEPASVLSPQQILFGNISADPRSVRVRMLLEMAQRNSQSPPPCTPVVSHNQMPHNTPPQTPQQNYLVNEQHQNLMPCPTPSHLNDPAFALYPMPFPSSTTVNNFFPEEAHTHAKNMRPATSSRSSKGPDIPVPVEKSKKRVSAWLINNANFRPNLDSGTYDPSDHSLQPDPSLPRTAWRDPGAMAGLAEPPGSDTAPGIVGLTGQPMQVVFETPAPKPRKSNSSRGSAQKQNKSQSINRNSASDFSMVSESDHGSEKLDLSRMSKSSSQMPLNQPCSLAYEGAVENNGTDSIDQILRDRIRKIAQKELPVRAPLSEKTEADLAIEEEMRLHTQRSLDRIIEGFSSSSDSGNKLSELAQMLASNEFEKSSLSSDDIMNWLRSVSAVDDHLASEGNNKPLSFDTTTYITPSEIESLERKKTQKGKSSFDGYLLHPSNEGMNSQPGASGQPPSEITPLREIALKDLDEVIGQDLDTNNKISALKRHKAQKRQPADSLEEPAYVDQSSRGDMTQAGAHPCGGRNSPRELSSEEQRVILAAQNPHRNSSSNLGAQERTVGNVRRSSYERLKMTEVQDGATHRVQGASSTQHGRMDGRRSQSPQLSQFQSPDLQHMQYVPGASSTQIGSTRNLQWRSKAHTLSSSSSEGQSQQSVQAYNMAGHLNFSSPHDMELNSALEHLNQGLGLNPGLSVNMGENQLRMIPVSLSQQQRPQQQHQQPKALTSVQTAALTTPLSSSSSSSVATAAALQGSVGSVNDAQFKKPYNIGPHCAPLAVPSYLSPQHGNSIGGDSDVSMHSDASLSENLALQGGMNGNQLQAGQKKIGGDEHLSNLPWQNGASAAPAGLTGHDAEVYQLSQALRHQQQQQQIQQWQHQQQQQQQQFFQQQQLQRLPQPQQQHSGMSQVSDNSFSQTPNTSVLPRTNLQASSGLSHSQIRSHLPGLPGQHTSPSNQAIRHPHTQVPSASNIHAGPRPQHHNLGPSPLQGVPHTNNNNVHILSHSSNHPGPQLNSPPTHQHHHHHHQHHQQQHQQLVRVPLNSVSSSSSSEDPFTASRGVIRTAPNPVTPESALHQFLINGFPSLDFLDEESFDLAPRCPTSLPTASQGPDRSSKDGTNHEKAGDHGHKTEQAEGNSLNKKEGDSDVSAVTIDDTSLGSDLDVPSFQPDSDGETSLHLLCDMPKEGREKLASLPGFHQALNLQNNNQETALFVAVKSKDLEVVKYLLSHGADVNVRCLSSAKEFRNERVQQTALHEAVEIGNLEIVKALLSAPNIQVDSRRPGTGLTPLMLALQVHTVKNRKDIVMELIRHQASLTLQDPLQGKTPLMYAIQSRDVTVVENILIMVGAERARALVTASAKKGMTCLHFAAELRLASTEKQKLLRCIIIAGGDASVKNSDGETARDWAKRDITEVLQNLAKLTKS